MVGTVAFAMMKAGDADRIKAGTEYWNRYDWLEGAASFTPVSFRSKRRATPTRLDIFVDAVATEQAAAAATAATPKRKPLSEISSNKPNATKGAGKQQLLEPAAKVLLRLPSEGLSWQWSGGDIHTCKRTHGKNPRHLGRCKSRALIALSSNLRQCPALTQGETFARNILAGRNHA